MVKRELPTKIVVNIGFKINLSKGSIRPDDKGLEKLFIVFFCVFKLDEPMSLVEQSLCRNCTDLCKMYERDGRVCRPSSQILCGL